MRLLLIEDESGVATFITQGLREEGYTVDLAKTGLDGLAHAEAEAFDAIILDVMLPGMDGLEVCRRLRAHGLGTPVLMLTARGTVPDRVRGLDSGADDYLPKPFEFDELLARLRALLRRRKDTLVELRAGPVRIDTQAHKVFVGHAEVALRPKEYAILELLVRRRGQAVSRTRILQNVWGYDFNPGTNVVDVHIKTLRTRLAECGAGSLITTVRGTGYRIDEPG